MGGKLSDYRAPLWAGSGRSVDALSGGSAGSWSPGSSFMLVLTPALLQGAQWTCSGSTFSLSNSCSAYSRISLVTFHLPL